MPALMSWLLYSPLSEESRVLFRFPIRGLLLLWGLAFLLAIVGLGDVPLRDFDEATVARVAFEIGEKKGLERLFPTLWNSQYLNKPPGLHWLIALLIQVISTYTFFLGH